MTDQNPPPYAEADTPMSFESIPFEEATHYSTLCRRLEALQPETVNPNPPYMAASPSSERVNSLPPSEIPTVPARPVSRFKVSSSGTPLQIIASPLEYEHSPTHTLPSRDEGRAEVEHIDRAREDSGYAEGEESKDPSNELLPASLDLGELCTETPPTRTPQDTQSTEGEYLSEDEYYEESIGDEFVGEDCKDIDFLQRYRGMPWAEAMRLDSERRQPFARFDQFGIQRTVSSNIVSKQRERLPSLIEPLSGNTTRIRPMRDQDGGYMTTHAMKADVARKNTRSENRTQTKAGLMDGYFCGTAFWCGSPKPDSPS
jgi:hypothetical protein